MLPGQCSKAGRLLKQHAPTVQDSPQLDTGQCRASQHVPQEVCRRESSVLTSLETSFSTTTEGKFLVNSNHNSSAVQSVTDILFPRPGSESPCWPLAWVPNPTSFGRSELDTGAHASNLEDHQEELRQCELQDRVQGYRSYPARLLNKRWSCDCSCIHLSLPPLGSTLSSLT